MPLEGERRAVEDGDHDANDAGHRERRCDREGGEKKGEVLDNAGARSWGCTMGLGLRV